MSTSHLHKLLTFCKGKRMSLQDTTLTLLMQTFTCKEEKVFSCRPLIQALKDGFDETFHAQLESKEVIFAPSYIFQFKLDWQLA